MTAYRCFNCGSERVTVDESRPSLDDRYAIGFCLPERERYAAKKKGEDVEKPDTRVKLVRSDLYDRVKAQHNEKKAIERRKRLMTAVGDPKAKTKLTPETAAEAKAMIAELFG